MRTRLLLASLLVPALLPAQAVVEGTTAPRISVTVTRSTRVAADRATMFVTIEGTGETAADAATRAEKKLQAVTDALKPLGVAMEGPFPYGLATLQPMNSYPGMPQTPQMVSRMVVRVPLTRLAQAGAVAAAAHAAGASSVPVMNYESTVADSLRRTLYREAMETARRDAAALAQAMNVTIGAATDASIGLSNTQPSFAFDQLFNRGFDPGPRGTPEVGVATTVTVRFPIIRN